ncbi:protein HESO1-like [Ananas comosus]|uniref:Protein HESO1 n=1 Tax=Ananas comosus TaxID=4615 RepID=A0A199W1Y1_ANACO|nr:protein HESO1-like [Ananas comosus]XP_020100755.1 protein HESO1-like [Ananas comosus]OAY83472.1 Protein HESO1 [Ananas comosus]
MEYYNMSTRRVSYDVLDICLKDILSTIKPSSDDERKRMHAISELETCIRSIVILKGAAVKPFGSFVSNLYTRWGDLDISIELPDSSQTPLSRKGKQHVLRNIMRALQRTGVAHSLQFIPLARVPLLICKSTYDGISCDISVNNRAGRVKSKILHWISDIDTRFRDMVLLTKEWAKAQDINDPKSGTLNSYSLCLLVIFHFQTCEPPILPPLKKIYEGNAVDDIRGFEYITERHIADICAANIRRYKSQYPIQRNRSSLSELLMSFFDKFSQIGTLSLEYAISTYTGGWQRINRNPVLLGQLPSIMIEDPFERPENAARSVGFLGKISDAFRDAYHKLSSRSMLSNRNALLALLTRPSISTQLNARAPERSTPKQINHQHYRHTGTANRFKNSEQIHERFRSALRLEQQGPSSSTAGYREERRKSRVNNYRGQGYEIGYCGVAFADDL